MKRFAAIVTIACLVLAMTAGTAFAAVCDGSACGDAMVCVPTASASCPMDSGQSMQHSMCDHIAQAQARDAVPVQPTHDSFVVAVSPVVVPPALMLGRLTREAHASDARGAPHLSVVIRT